MQDTSRPRQGSPLQFLIMRWVLRFVLFVALALSLHAETDSFRLEVAKQVDAVYPDQALKTKIEGEVVIRVAIGASGEVERAELVSGEEPLASSAMAAAYEWKFKTWKYGHYIPMPAVAKINFTFKLPEQQSAEAPSTPSVSGTVIESGEGLKALAVSAAVTQGMCIKKVAPVYPPSAKKARVQGSVVLHAVISKEGKIENLSVVSGAPELVDSAVDAVKQWEYKPYFLKGEPVAVQTTITVNYQLAVR